MSNKTRLQYQYFIDLGVPRSIEPSLEEFPGVILYNIDELQSQTSQILLKRMQAVPEVEYILAQSFLEFQEWTNEQVMSSAIGQLKQVLEFIRQEEIDRFAKKMPEMEMQVAEELTSSIIQKIITLPVLQLKAACKRGEADTWIKVLDEIFHLPKAA